MSGFYEYPKLPLVDMSTKKVGIVVAQWHEHITTPLFQSCYAILIQKGVKKSAITRVNVTGSYELPLASKRLVQLKSMDAAICLGCIIKGETPHFDHICATVTQGIMDVSLTHDKPIGLGVIMALNEEQALQRAGGELGNKGEEAAWSTIAMLSLPY